MFHAPILVVFKDEEIVTRRPVGPMERDAIVHSSNRHLVKKTLQSASEDMGFLKGKLAIKLFKGYPKM